MAVKIYDKLSKRELVYLNIDKIDEDRYENGFFTLYKNITITNNFQNIIIHTR